MASAMHFRVLPASLPATTVRRVTLAAQSLSADVEELADAIAAVTNDANVARRVSVDANP